MSEEQKALTRTSVIQLAVISLQGALDEISFECRLNRATPALTNRLTGVVIKAIDEIKHGAL